MEITRELAWKPRCAVIICVNVWARSTLDISTTPEVVKPNCGPGWPVVGAHEFADCSQRLEPERSRPAEFGNVASERKPADTRVPVPSTNVTSPFWAMPTLVEPAGTWISCAAPPASWPWT